MAESIPIGDCSGHGLLSAAESLRRRMTREPFEAAHGGSRKAESAERIGAQRKEIPETDRASQGVYQEESLVRGQKNNRQCQYLRFEQIGKATGSKVIPAAGYRRRALAEIVRTDLREKGVSGGD